MWATLLLLGLAGSPEDAAVEPPVSEPPAPALVEPAPPELPPRRIHRCLVGVEPCFRTTSIRLLLGSTGTLASATAVALIFGLGDRNRLGDPAVAIAGAGLIAVGGALIGGAAALLRGDGPALPDRITPATLAVGLGLGGSSVTDERVPYGLTGSIAPTWQFPRDRGRLRLLGSVGGELGDRLERDPRPQTQVADNGAGGTFATALESSRLWVRGGLDLALRLPYPIGRRSPWLGQFELRYKPLVFFARDELLLSDGESERVSERIALTPLNLGFRWIVSPRQRFTVYLGPRWDLIGYGEPGAVEIGAPALAPIYAESWFDLDVPLQKPRLGRRANAVGQLTLGYVHSRFGAEGIDVGSIVGFVGHMVTQFSLRVRPRESPVAYQFDLGARIGDGLNPFLRVGVVLPDLGSKR